MLHQVSFLEVPNQKHQRLYMVDLSRHAYVVNFIDRVQIIMIISQLGFELVSQRRYGQEVHHAT